MRNVAFKFRIYPTKDQAQLIRKACGCRRFVYNWGLEIKQKAYQEGRKINVLFISMMLPELKEKLPWLKEVNSQSHQAALRDLDMAFTRFFNKQAEYPRFKSRHRSKASFHVPQHFRINDDSLTLPKLGEVKAVIHREIIGKPKSITVSMSRSGNFFASVLCEQDVDDPEPKQVNPKTTIGIDVGIKTFVSVSDGRTFDNPKNLREAMSRIRFLSRQHAKKAKGGKNREKARLRLARQHEKVANRRNDFLHKVSHQLANESQVGTICVEDLNVNGMLKNHNLAGAISDCAWGELFRQLEYKCKWRGVRIVKIGRFEPSSRLCPCGFKNDALTLSDRSWICPKCGQEHDRDLLAARNVRRFGLAKLANPNVESSKKGGGRRRPKPGELPVNRERRTRNLRLESHITK